MADQGSVGRQGKDGYHVEAYVAVIPTVMHQVMGRDTLVPVALCGGDGLFRKPLVQA